MSPSIYVLMCTRHAEEHPMLQGVLDYAANLCLDWTVIPCSDRTDMPADVQRVASARPPAVIIGRSFPGNAVEIARSHGVRWVHWAYDGGPSSGDAAVMFDHESIGRVAAHYLKMAGARSLAVQGPMPHPRLQRSLRHQAFMNAGEESGMHCRVLSGEARSQVQWQENLRAFCNTMPRPIGFFLYHDDMAEHLINTLQTIGVNVPNEVLVVGCGDISVTQAAWRSISSVKLPYYSLGVAAAAQAERLLAGLTPEPVVIPAMGVSERGSTLADSHADGLISLALRYVARENSPIPSVTALAQLCKVDRRTLHKRFLRRLGMTPKAWLMERAMQRACRLLAETDMTLPEIARQCGIGYGTYLSTRFKQRFGVSTTSYRAQVRGL